MGELAVNDGKCLIVEVNSCNGLELLELSVNGCKRLEQLCIAGNC